MPLGPDRDFSGEGVISFTERRAARAVASHPENIEGEMEVLNFPPPPDLLLRQIQNWAREFMQAITAWGLEPDDVREGDRQYIIGYDKFILANTHPFFTEGFEQGDHAVQLELNFPEPSELQVTIDPEVFSRAIDEMTERLKRMADQEVCTLNYNYRRLMITFERLKAFLDDSSRNPEERKLPTRRVLLTNFTTTFSETTPGHPVIRATPKILFVTEDLTFSFQPDQDDPRRMALNVTVNALPAGFDSLLTSNDFQNNHDFQSFLGSILAAFEEELSGIEAQAKEQVEEEVASPVRVHLSNIKEEARLLLGGLRTRFERQLRRVVMRCNPLN